MKTRSPLKESMTLAEFDNGYWYATELKAFAHALAIPSSSRLRKDELERAIRSFLRTGRARIEVRAGPQAGIRDVERGLRLDLPVVRYTNDSRTKAFLEREARRMSPAHRRRSGARYRLNRWREAQLARGKRLTYRALVTEYVRLSRDDVPFARVPHGRYINFVKDFLANEAGATHARAVSAWHALKMMDVPKTYLAWSRRGGSGRGNSRRSATA